MLLNRLLPENDYPEGDHRGDRMTPQDTFDQWRFSTDDLPERDRLPHWREVCGRTMLRTDMEPLSDAPFHCTANIWMLPGLAVSSIVTAPNRLIRNREMIADGNDDFILAIPLAGGAAISQRGDEVSLIRGDAVLMSNAETSSSDVPCESHFLSLAIPAAALKQKTKNIGAALLRTIPGNSPSLRLLSSYVQALSSEQKLGSPELRHLAASHIHDLAALAVGASHDAAEIANNRGVRAARLRAIKTDVVANLGHHNLNAAMMASRHGVTPRYVNKLFEADGVTFSEYVLIQRLTFTHRMLSDLRFAALTISSIAFEAGFSDLSHFNRSFRRRYDATPTEIRDAAQRK